MDGNTPQRVDRTVDADDTVHEVSSKIDGRFRCFQASRLTVSVTQIADLLRVSAMIAHGPFNGGEGRHYCRRQPFRRGVIARRGELIGLALLAGSGQTLPEFGAGHLQRLVESLEEHQVVDIATITRSATARDLASNV